MIMKTEGKSNFKLEIGGNVKKGLLGKAESSFPLIWLCCRQKINETIIKQ